MSAIQRQGTDSDAQPSPGLGINLSSNNPFRNRATSPANSLPSPVLANFNLPKPAPERPTSKNPFLDQSERMGGPRPASPPRRLPDNEGRTSPAKPILFPQATELFDNLSLHDGPPTNGNRPDMPPSYPNRPIRSENVPPGVRDGLPGHHPSRSQEDQRRLRSGAKGRGPQDELNVFADPTDTRRGHKMRRNSESSIASRLLNPEEEKQRRERQRREREARHKDGKGRPPGSKTRKPAQRLDIIDSLDVTSIYGTGLFHHDGPFDACNPDRNRKGSRRAPMQAFAKDSANMAIGGSGPVHKDIDFNQFHGRGAEGFTDFSTSGSANTNTDHIPYEPYKHPTAPARQSVRPEVDRASAFDPVARVEQVHGEESLGLGTSTFLDGAPAPRSAIERRESESETTAANGLGRKRSLAQKIRGINNSHRGRVTSPENAGLMKRNTSPPAEAQSGGSMPRIGEGESNPLFNDYDEAYEKKGAKIQIAEEKNRVERSGSIGGGEEEFNAAASNSARARAMSSPKRPQNGTLERRVTNDGIGESHHTSNSGGGSFLSRVKSLKGGKRSRPERAI